MTSCIRQITSCKINPDSRTPLFPLPLSGEGTRVTGFRDPRVQGGSCFRFWANGDRSLVITNRFRRPSLPLQRLSAARLAQ